MRKEKRPSPQKGGISLSCTLCSRNTARESSQISFFSGGDSFCEVVRRPENTHEELTGLLEWPAGHSLRLRDQWISPLRLSDQLISAFSPKLHTLYIFSSPMRKYEYRLRPRIFLFMTGYRKLHSSVFFSRSFVDLICERKYLSFHP